MGYYQQLKLVVLFIIIHLGEISGQLNGTCDFNNRNWLCGYNQAKGSDGFDWSIEESNYKGYYLAIQTENYLVGETALLWSPEIRLQETHCFSFDYYLGSSGTTNSTETITTGQINVHIVDPELSDINQPIWTSTGLYQHEWHTVHLALNPNTYQVAFEGVILEQVEGIMAIDNVTVNAAACDSTPHFLRVSAKEVNVKQNESLTCILFGHTSPSIHVVMQKSTGELSAPSKTTDFGDHLSAVFSFTNVAVKNGGMYRCVSSEDFQSGVSNYAALSVKIPPTPKRSPKIIEPGSTSFLIELNADEYTGDGPIAQKILQYRPVNGKWSDVHHITTDQYRLWNLQPDTEYEMSLTLVRRGTGGTGSPGPELREKTKCGPPLASVQNVRFNLNGPGRVKLIWDVPSFKLTRCHTIDYLVKYHVYIPNQNASVANSAQNRIKTISKQGINTAVLRGLLPYTKYSIKLQLQNSAGSKETGWYTVQTQEQAPGPIPPDSLLVKFVTSTKIVLTWDKPTQLNGILKGYEVVYKGIESFDPNYIPENSDGYMETEHQNVTIDVHPGTTYEITVKALNGAGLGQESSIVVTSDIAAPSLHYPPPTSNKNDENPTTIAIQLIPADNNGAPVTRYYVIVEEVKPTNQVQSSPKPKRKKGKKKKKRRNERSLDSLSRVRRQTIGRFTEDNSCYKEPVSYEDAKNSNGSTYASAQFTPSEIAEERTFVVGDGSSYNGFDNPPLDPNKEYNVYVRAESTINGETKINCVLVAQKEKLRLIDTTPSNGQNTDKPVSDDGETTDQGVKEKQEQDTILYASVGGALIAIIIISLIIIILVVRTKNSNIRRRKKRTHKDEVVNPFEVRLMVTDRSGTPHSLQTKLNGDSPDRQQLMPDLVGYEQQDYMEKTSEHSGQPGYGSTSERYAIRVDDFHVHVSQMKATGGFGFREEYASIPNNTNVPCAVANSPQNKDKNRYGNILAYDHSRVILEPPAGHEEEFESDYINASYINGYKNPSMFIASQAPTAGTTDDFWWMVWQEKTNIIVMVTNLVEQGKQKCFKYWPDDRNTYGTVQVVFNGEENVCDYCVRTFMLQQSDGYDAREVKIFHFTAWPDHGVPSRPTNLLSFVRRVKAYEPAGQGPTIVHCSAGSGRTGCYIVICMMLEMARDEEIVDIYNTVCDLRTRRINMVQTEEQYVFIHEAILEALLCGETSVSAEMLMQHYDDLITVDQHSNFAPIQEEFETLNVITPKLSEEECSVARLPRNRASNRFMDVLPADRYLAYLLTPDPADRDNNYINAIYLDSYSIKNSFLVTQMPLPSTMIDIWRLVYDHNCTSIVMMNDVTEHDQTCCQYWPDSGTAIYGLFTVELLTKDEEVDVISRMFKITNTTRPNDGYRIVQQFQLTNWPATQPVPFSRNAVLRIIQLTTKWQDECSKLGDTGRTLVHCVAGAGRSGTFVACYNMCQQLRQEYSVDVFNIVQRLRNIRPQLVETLEQYRFCYEVGIEYADH